MGNKIYPIAVYRILKVSAWMAISILIKQH